MDFKDCIKKKIVKEIKKDENLINSLLKTSKNKLESVRKLEISEITCASKISLAYDSLRELLEALSIKNGYKIYNHECYTYFLKEILKQNAISEEFDELRKIRNSINYYAKEVSIEETKEILQRLSKLRKEILGIL